MFFSLALHIDSSVNLFVLCPSPPICLHPYYSIPYIFPTSSSTIQALYPDAVIALSSELFIGREVSYVGPVGCGVTELAAGPTCYVCVYSICMLVTISVHLSLINCPTTITPISLSVSCMQIVVFSMTLELLLPFRITVNYIL